MIKRVLRYEEVSREKQERLSRIANTEFILIGASNDVRFWHDDVEDVFYVEYMCNGPSTWRASE